MADDRHVQVTYREIAERFGIGIEGARIKAKRRAAKGVWRIIPGNHPQDIVRVEIPKDEFEGASAPQRGATHIAPDSPPSAPPQQEPQRREANDLELWVEVIAQLTAQSQAMTDRLIEAERAKAEAEKETALNRAALENAEAKIKAMAQGHFTELKAIRERLIADSERAKAELAEWKARPWWKRLAG